jgi:parvulin-like peptidyl-prolyl isomerase
LPKKRRDSKIPTPSWERDRGTLTRTIAGRSPQFYATVGIILLTVVAVGFIGFGFLSDYIKDKNRPDSTALTVGNSDYSLRYFTERLKTYVQQNGGASSGKPNSQAADPSVALPAVTEQIVQERILLDYAGEKSVFATEDEVKTEIATRLGIATDAPEFDSRLQEELVRSGLSEDQYRDVIKAAVLRHKLLDQLKTEVAPTAESANVRQIAVATQAEADDIRTQVEGGADFAQIAKEKSLDTQTAPKGGDVGWVPRGVLSKSLEDTLFALNAGALTTYPTGKQVVVYQVTEKQADRPLEDAAKGALANTALSKFFDEKRAGLEVKETVSKDVDKYRWAVKRAYNAA